VGVASRNPIPAGVPAACRSLLHELFEEHAEKTQAKGLESAEVV